MLRMYSAASFLFFTIYRSGNVSFGQQAKSHTNGPGLSGEAVRSLFKGLHFHGVPPLIGNSPYETLAAAHSLLMYVKMYMSINDCNHVGITFSNRCQVSYTTSYKKKAWWICPRPRL